MKKKIDYRVIPNKKTEPYSYHKWKELGLLSALPIERLIMLELNSIFGLMELLTQSKPMWDRKDMREFVRDLIKKMKQSKLL